MLFARLKDRLGLVSKLVTDVQPETWLLTDSEHLVIERIDGKCTGTEIVVGFSDGERPSREVLVVFFLLSEIGAVVF